MSSNERAGVEVFLGFEDDPESFWSVGEIPLLDGESVNARVRGYLHHTELREHEVRVHLEVPGDESPYFIVTLVRPEVPDDLSGLPFNVLHLVRD